jgi:hypothetical protein
MFGNGVRPYILTGNIFSGPYKEEKQEDNYEKNEGNGKKNGQWILVIPVKVIHHMHKKYLWAYMLMLNTEEGGGEASPAVGGGALPNQYEDLRLKPKLVLNAYLEALVEENGSLQMFQST